MATERIEIIIDEKGSRVVKVRIESIGKAALQSATGVDLLNRSLKSLEKTTAGSSLNRLSNAFGSVRIGLNHATKGTVELTRATKELGASARIGSDVERVGEAAERSTSGVNLLKTALRTLISALAVRELIRMVDTFTNLENRLRLVTRGTA